MSSLQWEPSGNPYAAPAAEPQGSGPPPPYLGKPRPWSIGTVLRAAWVGFRGHWIRGCWGILILVGLWVYPVLLSSQGTSAFLLGGVASLGGTLFLGQGVIRSALRLARGAKPVTDDYFGSWEGMAGLFVALIPFLTSIVFTLVASSLVAWWAGALGFGPLVASRVGIGAAGAVGLVAMAMTCGWLLAPFLCVDAGLSGLDALRISWTLTRGHRPRLFVLQVLLITVATVAFPIGVVGSVVALAVNSVALAVIYLRTLGSQEIPSLPPRR